MGPSSTPSARPDEPSKPGRLPERPFPRTLCVHGGRRPTPEDPGLQPSIQRSSTFLQHPATHAATDAGAWDDALVYARYGNPTVAACERRLAALEGAERAVLFGSGIAAMHAGLLALARPGSRIALARELYGGTLDMLRGELAALGFGLAEFDVADPASLEALLDDSASPDEPSPDEPSPDEPRPDEPVTLVVCESLSNPILVVADLPRIARVAHAAGARLLVDATFATPVLQRPLALGADLVMHSATKYLGGHSDLMAGVLAGAGEAIARARQLRKRLGALLDPHPAWLVERGLKTLALRVQAQCANALALARALAEHPAVARVHYPGLASHPGHSLAAELLEAGGGLLSFELAAGDGALRAFVARLELALDAPSLGGVETLVSLPVYMSHAALSPDERRRAGIAPGLVRVALGIEDSRDVVADFLQALEE